MTSTISAALARETWRAWRGVNRIQIAAPRSATLFEAVVRFAEALGIAVVLTTRTGLVRLRDDNRERDREVFDAPMWHGFAVPSTRTIVIDLDEVTAVVSGGLSRSVRVASTLLHEIAHVVYGSFSAAAEADMSEWECLAALLIENGPGRLVRDVVAYGDTSGVDGIKASRKRAGVRWNAGKVKEQSAHFVLTAPGAHLVCGDVPGIRALSYDRADQHTLENILSKLSTDDDRDTLRNFLAAYEGRPVGVGNDIDPPWIDSFDLRVPKRPEHPVFVLPSLSRDAYPPGTIEDFRPWPGPTPARAPA